MRRSVTSYCMPSIKANNNYDDVNGLDVTLLPNNHIPFLPAHLFYSLHTMRRTRALLLHQIACQDLLLAQQEELLRKMYGQLQRTTNNYMQALENIYNEEEGGNAHGER